MAQDQLFSAMMRLAERLKRGDLTYLERSRLEREFEQAEGSAAERATKAIAATLRLTERDITTKAAVYDDIGRLLEEVQTQADDWEGAAS